MRRLSGLLFLILAMACNKEITNVEIPLEATVLATPNNRFVDDNTSIQVGGTVRWQFQANHSVIFTPKAGAPSDIPESASGATESRVFTTSGAYPYQCGVTGHTEIGTINVIIR